MTSLQKDLLTGAPQNNHVTIKRECAGVTYITEVFGNVQVSSTCVRAIDKQSVALDETVENIKREQQEIGRAIAELLTVR